MARYSKQRQAVLDVLCSTKTHPTATWIYDRIREQMPNISLGTVYRNLRRLADDGEILCFIPNDGVERFDGDITSHHHLKCDVCGAVVDLPYVSDKELTEKLEALTDCTVTSSSVMFFGICGSCNGNNN